MDPLLQQCIDQHLPTPSQKTYHCGLLILIAMAVGFGYSYLLMEVPAGLTPEDLEIWKMGLGAGFSLLLATAALVLYIVWILSRARLVKRSYAEKLADRLRR